KAMEFNTLTRRVAEFSGVEAAEIEASQPSTRPLRASDAAALAKPSTVTATPSSAPGLPLFGGAMAPKPRPGGPGAAANIVITPQALEAERTEAARKAKFDRSRYEIVGKRDRLDAFVARAREIGVVAINAETVGEDPMQATICGIALAIAPNEACY